MKIKPKEWYTLSLGEKLTALLFAVRNNNKKWSGKNA